MLYVGTFQKKNLLFAKGETDERFVCIDVDILREQIGVLLDGCQPNVLFAHMLTYVKKKFRRERDHRGDPDVYGRIILRWIFRKWEWVVGTGWSWLRIGTGGGHL